MTAGAVEATFANFAPAMVRRAIPDAWDYADPSELTAVRCAAAAAALRGVVPGIERAAGALNADLARAIDAGDAIGRPLFTANRDVAAVDDPVAQLWQHCTTLREHRGDGHVAALAAAGIDGCQAHLLLAADQGVPAEVFVDNRGWDPEHQQRATDGLHRRGLLGDGGLTDAGRQLRHDAEATTDALAAAPFEALDAERRAQLLDALDGPAEAVQRSGIVPFPNPMGLPPLTS